MKVPKVGAGVAGAVGLTPGARGGAGGLLGGPAIECPPGGARGGAGGWQGRPSRWPKATTLP